jgi:NAD(P)-dependent dehydrogenase (short-subunit alcohol dehydrogenase family)
LEQRAQQRRKRARRNDIFWRESDLEKAEKQARKRRSAQKTNAPPPGNAKGAACEPDHEQDVKRQIELAAQQLKGIDTLAANAEQAGQALGVDVPNDDVRRIFDGHAEGVATDPFRNPGAYVGRAARRC